MSENTYTRIHGEGRYFFVYANIKFIFEGTQNGVDTSPGRGVGFFSLFLFLTMIFRVKNGVPNSLGFFVQRLFICLVLSEIGPRPVNIPVNIDPSWSTIVKIIKTPFIFCLVGTLPTSYAKTSRKGCQKGEKPLA